MRRKKLPPLSVRMSISEQIALADAAKATGRSRSDVIRLGALALAAVVNEMATAQ